MTTSLSGIDSLVSYLPALVGRQPDETIIVIGMRGSQVHCTLCIDARRLDRHGGERAVPQVRAAIGDALRAESVSDLVLVDYRTPPGAFDGPALREWLNKFIAPVSHEIVVCGDVWWANHCDFGCCDGALQALTVDNPPSGMADSDDESRRLLCHDAAQAARVTAIMPPLGELDADGCRRAWDRLVTNPKMSTIENLAVLVAACPRTDLRDVMLWGVVPEMAAGLAQPTHRSAVGAGLTQARNRGQADDAPAALREVLPLVPLEAQAYWLALLGLAHWRAGDLEAAQEAASLAHDEGPNVPLAQLAHSLTQHAMPYPGVPGPDPRGSLAA